MARGGLHRTLCAYPQGYDHVSSGAPSVYHTCRCCHRFIVRPSKGSPLVGFSLLPSPRQMRPRNKYAPWQQHVQCQITKQPRLAIVRQRAQQPCSSPATAARQHQSSMSTCTVLVANCSRQQPCDSSAATSAHAKYL
jgi:hypothetical protein